MNLLAIFGQFYIPNPVSRTMLRQLFQLTAEAFKAQVPSLEGLDSKGILRMYASFTREKAEEAAMSKDWIEIGRRLRRNAYDLGQRVRSDYRVNNTKDVMRISRVVYKILGIEFRGHTNGEVLITRCYFSGFYSPIVCRLMSALDEGFLTGLSGGNGLSFVHRITDGDTCCSAHLAIEVKK